MTGRRPPPKEAWTGRPCPSVGSREHVSNSRSFSLCVELNLPIKELLTPPLGSAGMRTREQQRGRRLGAGRRPSLLGVTHRGETSARRAEAATGRHPRPRGLKHRDARPHLWTREAQGRLLPGPPSFPCVSLTELYLHSDEEARDSCGASSPEWTRSGRAGEGSARCAPAVMPPKVRPLSEARPHRSDPGGGRRLQGPGALPGCRPRPGSRSRRRFQRRLQLVRTTGLSSAGARTLW